MLEVNGNASKSTAGSWLANSDRRIKTDVRLIENGLETLLRVNPVNFRYTKEYLDANPGIADRRYLNVIAQEFAKVFPDYVQDSGETLPDGSQIMQVDTYPLTIYTTAAIRELHTRLIEKEKALSEQSRLLAQTMRSNRELQRRIESIEEWLQKD